MDSVKKLETLVGGLFKSAPPLPKNARDMLVKAWPWIALIFGILQLMAAWGLWNLARSVDRLNTIANIYTYQTGLSSSDRFMIYLGIAVLVVDAVILLMAYPELAKRKARGWDLLFLGSIINVVYSLVSLFISDRGAGTFFFSGISSVIGFYLLFQVRPAYKGGTKKSRKS
ncbi:MAG TPA: hypothetical protein VK694_06145 [Verrucomicrobiae bacterium]|nr:hypothetical protein [Verrucomicrobiae bacterium]